METTTGEMPHNGNLLEQYVKTSGSKVTQLSREMGYSSPLLMRLYKTPSIRTHIWWKLGLLINRNIFADFADIFPIEHKSKRIEQLEAELADAKKELEIYRRIVGKTL